MLKPFYYASDADRTALDGLVVGIIGYGGQGRAFAANLRDSGVAVRIGNIADAYRDSAVADGHTVLDIETAVLGADIVVLLIPDDAHKQVFDTAIAPVIRPGSTLIVAHGHSLSHGEVVPVAGVDLAMLAPRMYGDPIRAYYLAGAGAPAYLDIVADATGKALARVLAVADAVGFTRAGVMPLDHRQETILDLFQEQFVAPALVDLVETGFRVLVERGFDPRAALLEVYGSGEIGKMMLDGAAIGLDEVIRTQGSPACQVGYHLYRDRLLPEALTARAHEILTGIENGSFAALMSTEAAAGYPLLAAARRAGDARALTRVHHEVRAAFRFPGDKADRLYAAGGDA